MQIFELGAFTSYLLYFFVFTRYFTISDGNNSRVENIFLFVKFENFLFRSAIIAPWRFPSFISQVANILTEKTLLNASNRGGIEPTFNGFYAPKSYTEKFSRLKFKLLSKTLGHKVLKDAVAENFNDFLLNNRRSYLNGRTNWTLFNES